MNEKINLVGRSVNFPDHVLIWESELASLGQTDRQVFSYQVRDGERVYYSVNSFRKAFIGGIFFKANRDTDGRPFIGILKSILEEV